MGKFFNFVRPVVLNPGCTLELSGEFLKIPVLNIYLYLRDSDLKGPVGSQSFVYFKTPQMNLMCTQG